MVDDRADLVMGPMLRIVTRRSLSGFFRWQLMCQRISGQFIKLLLFWEEKTFFLPVLMKAAKGLRPFIP